MDLEGYQVADLVDLGHYQAVGLVGLVDREGLIFRLIYKHYW